MKNKGFTLVEVLVAMGIFSLVVGMSVSLFASAIRAQERSLREQQIIDQVSYAVEYMSRALRMARKDITGNCVIPCASKSNYCINGNEIRFINSKGFCQSFYLSGDQLWVWDEDSGDNLELISPNLKVSDFNIILSGNDQDDNFQPRVTIFFAVEETETRTGNILKHEIQTTVSQRNPDVPR